MKPTERTYNRKYNRKMVRNAIRAHYGSNKMVGTVFHQLRGTLPMKERRAKNAE